MEQIVMQLSDRPDDQPGQKNDPNTILVYPEVAPKKPPCQFWQRQPRMPFQLSQRLTDEQMVQGWNVARDRFIHHMHTRQTSHRWGLQDNPADYLITGNHGEIRVADWLGIPWDGGKVGDYNDKDVGECLQVRSTTYGNGRMTVHPDAINTDIYVLVTIAYPYANICGWKIAKECKVIEAYWSDITKRGGRPAFNLPQNFLNDPRSLIEYLQGSDFYLGSEF